MARFTTDVEPRGFGQVQRSLGRELIGERDQDEGLVCRRDVDLVNVLDRRGLRRTQELRRLRDIG